MGVACGDMWPGDRWLLSILSSGFGRMGEVKDLERSCNKTWQEVVPQCVDCQGICGECGGEPALPLIACLS